MPPYVATNRKLWVDGFDLSGDMNAIGLRPTRGVGDGTVFDGSKHFKGLPGLKAVRFSHAGLWQAGTDLLDDVLFSRFNAASMVQTIGAVDGVEGDAGLSLVGTEGEYNPISGRVGDPLSFELAGWARDRPLVRGTIVHNATRSAGGNGTAFNLGAVGASQKLYGILHVIAISGGGIWTFKVQSDDAQGFGSALDRITFADVTVRSAQFATPVAGAISDTWWRANWAVAGGAGNSITFIVLVGIQE